jgi:hypothetical protein
LDEIDDEKNGTSRRVTRILCGGEVVKGAAIDIVALDQPLHPLQNWNFEL